MRLSFFIMFYFLLHTARFAIRAEDLVHQTCGIME